MNRNKARGTAFETLITRALQDAFPDDDRIDRAPLRGAKDEGDIRGVRSPFGRVVIECKNHNRLELAAWVDEAEVERGNADAIAGAVVHKRRGKGQALDQYVTMTVRDLVALLGGEV
ncbi:hypothetical protein IT072_02550 [Leifsonia sp. ZF2019]|uniref:hypothetical protein n=1 Tax=Leifsonia sp. ZF2019 TaxID=2781978 RepID=UPI001CBF8EA0|nr:hypothetical protein [Leifsonia sp. ZF2019]UAJ79977.1 hypothetical protein IT072_02550 [Leifsonia sp. ZF2019]